MALINTPPMDAVLDAARWTLAIGKACFDDLGSAGQRAFEDRSSDAYPLHPMSRSEFMLTPLGGQIAALYKGLDAGKIEVELLDHLTDLVFVSNAVYQRFEELPVLHFNAERIPEFEFADVKLLTPLEDYLAAVEALLAFEDGNPLSLDQGALLSGRSRDSLRTMVYAENKPLKRAPDNTEVRTYTVPAQGVAIDGESFREYVRTVNYPLWVAFHGTQQKARNLTPASSEKVEHHLLNALGYSYHPKCNPTTKLMVAFTHPNGSVLALQRGTGAVAKAWIPVPGESALEKLNPLTARFSSNRNLNLAPGEKYGRHSGLKKYPELKAANLALVDLRVLDDLNIISQFQAQSLEGDAK